ncbi:hypothetical protein SAMN05421837_107133 [Amycolatopsis pretoriensis]|uniref:SAV-6107-like HEPN domain-containing protein n=1 Tax=Amycolatopsis pretoriensis TaxID=218821 RepID=A0A1H5R7C1_9PSEU|nr:SAV_6107 family HEPN domain-containing protein [Amycolatopsis pretoriensis]SEF33964.1 hypothetical protein SAMN05421837_107133 [Amycolatopsis pretoriensis]
MSVKVVSPTESGQPQLPMSLRPHTGRSPLRPSVSSAPPVPGCVEPRKPRRRPVDAGQPELPMTPEPAAAPVAGTEPAERRAEPSRPAAEPAVAEPELPSRPPELPLEAPAAAASVPEQPRPAAEPAEPELPMLLRPPAAAPVAEADLQLSLREPAAVEPAPRSAAAPELPSRPPAAGAEPSPLLAVESAEPELPMLLRPPAAAPVAEADMQLSLREPAAVEPVLGSAAEPELPTPVREPAAVEPAPRSAAEPELPSRPPTVGAEPSPLPAVESAEPELPMLLRPPAAAPVAEPELPPHPPATEREQSQLPMSLRPPAPPVAAGLLAQARRQLAEAERETDPVERFVGAYLAALRGAAAVLAARGRPHRGRARPASTWLLLDSVAPELREWSAFFASNSAARAAAQAGITGKVSAESAAGLVRAATPFLELVRRLVHGLPITGEAHVA